MIVHFKRKYIHLVPTRLLTVASIENQMPIKWVAMKVYGDSKRTKSSTEQADLPAEISGI